VVAHRISTFSPRELTTYWPALLRRLGLLVEPKILPMKILDHSEDLGVFGEQIEHERLDLGQRAVVSVHAPCTAARDDSELERWHSPCATHSCPVEAGRPPDDVGRLP
jgi:hypothetical protein